MGWQAPRVTDTEVAPGYDEAGAIARAADAWGQARGTGLTGQTADRVQTLAAAWLLLRRAGAGQMVASGWVGAMAGAPDPGVSSTLVLLACDRVQPGAPERTEWLDLGDVGPLVFAAGLVPGEARVGLALGTLTRDGLETLAGLRGWLLPPLSVLAPETVAVRVVARSSVGTSRPWWRRVFAG